MKHQHRNLLLVLAVVLVAGFTFGLWRLASVSIPQASPPSLDGIARTPSALSPSDRDVPPAREELSGGEAPSDPALETTVVLPLEIELELVRPDLVPRADGVMPLGSAATARIKGSLHTAGDRGVRGDVTFVAGANIGRVLYCDGLGAFGANDLYPGLSVVQVAGPGIPGSLREVLLRQGRETPLNLGYGRPASVQGEVLRQDGTPIAGARVVMDGQEAQTDDSGTFIFPRMTPGEVLVFVELAGYATLRQKLGVVGATEIAKGSLKYVLEPAARLTITLEDRINVDTPALLFLLPQDMHAERKFPWYRVNPVNVWPGGVVTIEDLPPGPTVLRLYHAGAIAKPRSRVVNLRAGETVAETLHMVPAPVLNGTIRHAGAPVANAVVRLEPPDRVQATLLAFDEATPMFLESEVLPNVPPAVQETRSNALGEYVLNASEEISKDRYLSAFSPDGRLSATKMLRGGETRVDLVLEARQGGAGVLRLQTNARFQALPVRVTVNGAPRDRMVVPPGRDVLIDDLGPGTWRLGVRWDADMLVEKQMLEIREEVPWSIVLPEGAILGQDEDLRKRAKGR